MIMPNQYNNDLGSLELIQVKESEPLGGVSAADGVAPLRYTLANRQPTLTITDRDKDTTTDDSDEDESGPETHNDNEVGDLGVENAVLEVREDIAQIRAPIAQIKRKRRSAARKRVGRAKKTGKNGKKWTKVEKKWLFECYCWKMRLGSGFMEDVSRMYHTREYEHRTNASLYAQLKSIKNNGLTVMERECIIDQVKKERIGWGLAWDYLDGLWEDDRIFHAFDCECCMSDHTDSDDNNDENQGDEVEEVEYTLRGLGNTEQDLNREEDENLEQDGLVRAAGAGDEDVNEEGDLPDGEADVAAVPAEAEPAETDTWNESDGSVRALTEDEKIVMRLMREVYGNGEWKEIPTMKAVPRKKLLKETELVDGLMHNIVEDGMGVTEVNRLLYTAGMVVASRLGLKLGGGQKAERKKPHWQRRIETSIKAWRKDLSQVEEIRKGTNVGMKVRKALDRKYNLTERGAASVSTFIKGKIEAGNKKIQWFVQRKVARRQNNLFQNNQRQLYKELGGETSGNTNEVPDAADSRKFWEGIWSVETEHNKDAVWLDDIRKKMGNIETMEDIVISAEDVLYVIKKMTNWKAPGPDGVRGFWFKKLKSLHGQLTHALQECVANGVVPEWLTKGRTVLIQKDKSKGKAVSNYRPIACLPLMWKLLTGIFALKIYDHLHANNSLPFEQKGCRKQSRGTKDQFVSVK